jgi:hypothetical protein
MALLSCIHCSRWWSTLCSPQAASLTRAWAKRYWLTNPVKLHDIGYGCIYAELVQSQLTQVERYQQAQVDRRVLKLHLPCRMVVITLLASCHKPN